MKFSRRAQNDPSRTRCQQAEFTGLQQILHRYACSEHIVSGIFAEKVLPKVKLLALSEHENFGELFIKYTLYRSRDELR